MGPMENAYHIHERNREHLTASLPQRFQTCRSTGASSHTKE